jgi:putative addiction module killer protein
MTATRIVEYLDAQGRSPFGRWLQRLDARAAVKVTTALYRLEQGNVSNTRAVGHGVFEVKIDFGPGYRVYCGRDGTDRVVLLGGGSKKRQQADIGAARVRWADYKQRRA